MASNLLLSLGSGVISGLVASGLLLFFSSFWSSSIVPWYEERIYKDARIEGKWRGVDVVVFEGETHGSVGLAMVARTLRVLYTSWPGR
jgi:hypothetical protein